MPQSEEEIRKLEEATRKHKARLQKQKYLERSYQMSEEDTKALHKMDNPLEHITFAPVWFANFSLPHSDRHHTPEGSTSQPKRELVLINGDKKLTLYSRIGLPSGVIARKFLFWITTEALKQKHLPVEIACHVPVKSLRAIMKDMEIPVSGGKTGTVSSLRTQMGRVVRMSYYEDSITSPKLEALGNYNIAKKVFFNWEDHPDDEVELNPGSQIILDQDFFLEIADNGAVPLDKRILARLTRSPLATDLYVWLTYRLSYQSSYTRVTFNQLYKQFATGYPDTERGHRNFKTKVHAAFSKVIKAWEEVTQVAPKVSLVDNGILLRADGKPSVPQKVIQQIVQEISTLDSDSTDTDEPLF